MNSAPLSVERIVDGRAVVDELPCRVDVLPGEVELVAQHLLEVLGDLLADRSDGTGPAQSKSNLGPSRAWEGVA